MYPVLTEVFGFEIYTYGVLMAIALYTAVQWAVFQGKLRGFSEEIILNLSIISVLCGLLGARLTYVALYFDQYIDNPIEILMIWRGGMVFYGGLIGGVIAGVGYWVYSKQRLLPMVDIAAMCVSMGHAIGRLGCFFYGCCYGMVIESGSKFDVFGVHFPGLEGLRHPTQIYASLGNILIFFLLFLVYKRSRTPGFVTVIYCYVYGVFRFLIEMIRDDYRGQLLGISPFSPSQTIAIAGVLLGVGLHIYLLRQVSKRGSGTRVSKTS
jgi:phosphatidylglycerol---prolipoprotein diacylglyceryl transferase